MTIPTRPFSCCCRSWRCSLAISLVLAASGPRPLRGRGRRRPAVRRGADHLRPARRMLPEPLGAEGIGLSEKNGRVFYPAIDSPAFGKLVKELLDSDTPLDLRRAGARRGGRAAARNPRPSAANHRLFPLPRRRAAASVAAIAKNRRTDDHSEAADRAGDRAASGATLPPVIAACCNCGGSNTPRCRGCCSRSPTIRRCSTTI